MRNGLLLILFIFISSLAATGQTKPPLGTTANFTVLAGTQITNTGSTVIDGNVGIWPGTVISGFPPGIINGSQHINNATSQATQADLTVAYNNAASRTPTSNLSGQNLGGRTITPGVHRFDAAADLTGNVTFDANNDPNAIFIIQVGGDFTTSANAAINLRAGARASNIFWQIGGNMTTGNNSTMRGTFMVNQSITMGTGASLEGNLFARNGFVRLNSNPLTIPLNFTADLSVTKTVSPGPYYKGMSVTYKVTVKNLGPSDETNVIVEDILPPGLSYLSSSTTRSSSYNPATGRWVISNFNNGAVDTLTIVATLTATGFVTNTATIASAGIDLIKTNNGSSVSICAAPEQPGEITGPISLCIGSTGHTYSIAPVPGATSYLWYVPTGWTITSGQNTTSITVSAGTDTLSATIFVTALNSCDQSLASTRIVYATNEPPAAPGAITGNSRPCRNQNNLTYSVPPVRGASNYTWAVPSGWTITAGQGTNSITVNAGTLGGSVTVTVSNGCGTSSATTLVVTPTSTVPPVPGPITGNKIPCSNTTGNVYSIDPVPDATSYNWIVPTGWTILSGQGTTSITVAAGSTGGTISVSAANSCGSGTAIAEAVSPTATAPAAPGTITGPINVCSSQAGITYSIAAVPGASAYSWTVPNGWTITSGQGTPVITVSAGSTSGTITVTASNGCGTSAASSLAVVSAASPPAAPGPIAGNTIPCVGNTANIYSITAVPGAISYNWTVPTGWTITSGQGSTAITVTAGSNTGVISVTATNSCGTGPATILVVLPSAAVPPTPGPISGSTQPCSGGVPNTYSIAAVPGASAYLWTVPTGWTITSGQGTTSITVTAGTNLGNISVTASNSCGTGTSSILGVTPIQTLPATPGAITGNTTLCAGQTVTYSIPAAAGASSYTWSVPNGWAINSGQGTTSITVSTGSSSGNISVTATNSCGNTAASTLPVAVTTTPAAPGPITGNIIPCSGPPSNSYSIAPVAGATSYSWTLPAGWVINSGRGTTAITVTTNGNSGTVSVTASNACGTSPATTLVVTPAGVAPSTPGPISGDKAPCVGSTGNTYTIAPVLGASSYNWTVPTDWTITSGQGTTSITVTAGNTNGAVSVTASNGCGTSPASILAPTLTTSPPPAPGAITGNTIPCTGNTSTTYSITPVPGAVSYTWNVPTGWTITSGQGNISITVTPGLNAGTISVVAVNSCGNSAASSVAVTPAALAPLSAGMITGDTAICAGAAGNTFSIATVPNAASYNWTVPTGWTITSGQGTTSITVTAGNTNGAVSVTASNGCGSSTPSMLRISTLTVPSMPVAILGDSLPCINSSGNRYRIAPVPDASSYNWTVPAGWSITSGQGTTAIEVTAGNTAGQILVKAVNKCGESSEMSLDVRPATTVPPAPFSIIGSNSLCSGQSLVYSVTPVNNSSYYTWTMPAGWVILSGQGTPAVTVAAGSNAGTISVTAANGCGASTATTLAVVLTANAPDQPDPITGDSIPCANSTTNTYSIAPVAGATSYTWTVPAGWTIAQGQNTTSITVTAGANGGVISVTASNNCGVSPAAVLAVAPGTTAPALPGAITGDSIPCFGSASNTYSIAPVANASSYTWKVPAGWSIISGQGTTTIVAAAGAGAGQISVTAENGCGVSAESVFRVTPATTAPVLLGRIQGVTAICGQETLTYSIPAAANASGYTWSVPQGWTITSGQGTNTIRVTAGQGAGEVSVIATNGCGSSSESILRITIKPVPATPAAIVDESSPCRGLVFSITDVPNTSGYTWTVPQGWTITSGQGTTRITVQGDGSSGVISVTADNGTCISAPAVSGLVNSAIETAISIPNAFSPNGDGNNDTWVIGNLLSYPQNELVLINRWGNEVYRTTSYRNNWNGGELSAGTYFYVLKVKGCNNEEQTYKGYVMIVR